MPRVGWTTCGDQLECASVPVPLDWDEPNGPRIALSVIRRLASRPDQRIGSLLVNPGGPGDSGVGYVAERGLALDALTQGRFDIVGWDIRGGAGGSAPGGLLRRRRGHLPSGPHAASGAGRGSGLCRQPGPPSRPGLAAGRRQAGSHQPYRRTGGRFNAPCTSWPVASADRSTGPWNATTKHLILLLHALRAVVDGAIATLLGILHEAQLIGDWRRLKGCRHCGYAFFDYSRNRSATWNWHRRLDSDGDNR